MSLIFRGTSTVLELTKGLFQSFTTVFTCYFYGFIVQIPLKSTNPWMMFFGFTIPYMAYTSMGLFLKYHMKIHRKYQSVDESLIQRRPIRSGMPSMELAQPPGTGERGCPGMAAEYRGGPGKIGWSVVGSSGSRRMCNGIVPQYGHCLIIGNCCVYIFWKSDIFDTFACFDAFWTLLKRYRTIPAI